MINLSSVRLLGPVLLVGLLGLLMRQAPADPAADPLLFDDAPLADPLPYPAWFKKSFLDLHDDLKDAVTQGKRGIVLYFGQKRCAYCRQLMQVNFGQPDIETYTRRHFDLVPIDVWGIESVTDFQGNSLSERELAERESTHFTPSLIFYNAEGQEALRLRGYYPPYQFRAALEYVVDEHYRKESFQDYLSRGDAVMTLDHRELNEEELFSPPPHQLDRSQFPGERLLAVFFEQGDCHACDILHGQVMSKASVRHLLSRFETVQLNVHSATPVVTPAGKSTTARDWAHDLGIFYAPSILFFDQRGREIIRVESVVHLYRLQNILDYLSSGSYLSYPSFQAWRIDHYLGE